MEKTLEEMIGEAIGEASMCWSETPEGVFDTTRAKEIIDSLVLDVREWAASVYDGDDDTSSDDE